MKFDYGNTGRPKGTKNKVNADFKQLVSELLSNNRDKFELELNELKGMQFCQIYLKMTELIVPKPKWEPSPALWEGVDVAQLIKDQLNATY